MPSPLSATSMPLSPPSPIVDDDACGLGVEGVVYEFAND